MIVDDFVQYLERELNMSACTVRAYKTDLRQMTDFLAGGKELDVASVTTVDVRQWLVQRSQQGDGAATLRRKVQAVRALYKWLMRRGVVDDNPAADIELAKLPQRLPHYMRQVSMDSLLDSEIDKTDFEQVRNRLVVMMFYETGMRRAELISLLDENVDTAACQLKVHGKRDKDRIIPFGDELKTWIETYRGLRDKEMGRVTEFFVRPNGEPLYPSLVYNVVHTALEQVGGSGKFSPHVLRHSFASAMLNNGAEINSVKELLGHESLAATQVYTHITFSELKQNYKQAHPRALKKGG